MTDEMKAAKPEDCLAGVGEMGALMRALDWSKTLLDPVSSWPQSLRTAVSILLASRFPMLSPLVIDLSTAIANTRALEQERKRAEADLLEKLRVHLQLEWIYETDGLNLQHSNLPLRGTLREQHSNLPLRGTLREQPSNLQP